MAGFPTSAEDEEVGSLPRSAFAEVFAASCSAADDLLPLEKPSPEEGVEGADPSRSKSAKREKIDRVEWGRRRREISD